MIALLQRVTRAEVAISDQVVGAIDAGLLVLVGFRPTDTDALAADLLERVLRYRVFADSAGKMNRSVIDVQGGVLLVPQFTLAADTHRGLRPGFSTAAPPAQAKRLFDALLAAAKARHSRVASGTFGADMQVSLTNDGPVTFWLES